MRYALFLPPFDELADPRLCASLAAEAEEHNWDGFFVWDHTTYRPPVQAVADPWVVLSAVAVATERLRIGPMVTPLPRRRPVKVARETATLDVLAQGRLVLGVGIGGDGSRELSAVREQTDDRVRGAMLDEHLHVLAAAWSGEPVHHHGTHYVVDGVQFLPTPVQRYGNRAPLLRAARHDGAVPIEVESPDQLAEVGAALRRERGDDPRPFDLVVGGRPGTDPRPFRDAGATWWTVSFPLETTADDVRGVLREGPPV
jgi:alkanesulfonate monooxygenase SsuD/methylene tetrahydromethanopterin reductase-like flavin-dependent oxidoreductase (luciferase family)